jgi:hypothetical protein
MPRQAKLRKKVGKSVYWFTKAGGDTYFSSVTDVPYKEARRRFIRSCLLGCTGNTIHPLKRERAFVFKSVDSTSLPRLHTA